MGRLNGWDEGYWREISWGMFWASVAEARSLQSTSSQAEQKDDPVATLEQQVAEATGLPTPLRRA